jgi:DNA ligase (NAD+)
MSNLVKKLEIKDFKTINKKGKLGGKFVMFTGGLKKISRSEAKSLVEENGGKVLGSLSKKLDMIVVGDSKPTKKKIEKARELKIQVISETEWYKFLNI